MSATTEELIRRLVAPDGTVLWDAQRPVALPTMAAAVAAIYGKGGGEFREDLLRATTAVVIAHAPPKQLGSWCDWLISGGDPSKVLRPLSEGNSRRVCGYVFKRGDIAWNCRDCQSDGTCVQCDACFRRADHTGHEVHFHRTAQGCCDCGDVEAWDARGCCPRHGPADVDVDPMAALPVALRASAAAVTEEAVELLRLVVWDTAAGYESAETNPWLAEVEAGSAGGEKGGEGSRQPAAPPTVLDVRLHNDDINSFDKVITTLRQRAIGMTHSGASKAAEQVHEVGCSIVLSKCRVAEAREALVTLQGADLRAALVTAGHQDREARAAALVSWLSKLCGRSDGLCRLVGRQLCTPPPPGPPRHGPVAAATRSVSTARPLKSRVMGARESAVSADDPTLEFAPLAAAEAEASYAELARDGGVGTSGDMWPPLAGIALAPLVLADPLLAPPLRASMHGLYMRLLVDPPFKRDFAVVFSRLYRRLNCMFGNGIGTSEDSIFGFSVQLYTTPSLVQLLSDAGAVMESPVLPPPRHDVAGSDGAGGAGADGNGDGVCSVWPPPRPQGLVAMLVSALLDAFARAGRESVWASAAGAGGARGGAAAASAASETDEFLDNRVTVSRRFAHAFRDLEYALQQAGVARDVARAAVPGPGPDPLRWWLELLAALQNMDQHTRRTGTHIEFESMRWIIAFGISLSLASASDILVDWALPPAAIAAASTAAVAGSAPGEVEAGMAAMDTSGSSPAAADVAEAAGADSGQSGTTMAAAGAALSRAAVAALQTWLEGHAASESMRIVSPAASPPVAPLPAVPRVGYAVSFGPVSLHLPLHRFLAKVVLALADAGLPLPLPLPLGVDGGVGEDDCDDFGGFARGVVEFPLRALVFEAQVLARLWVRNGGAAASQAVNYTTPPLCRQLRDLDLVCLQMGICSLGCDAFLLSLLERFALDRWLLDPSFVPPADDRGGGGGAVLQAGHYLALAEELFTLLVVLATEVPPPPRSDRVHRALRRELIHRLAAAPCTHSEAVKVAGNVGEEVTESDVERALQEVAVTREGAFGDRRGGEGGGGGASAPRRFELSDTASAEYDPCYFHLSRQEHQVAAERVAGKRRALRRAAGPAARPLPMAATPAPAHEAFARVRTVLWSPAVLRACAAVLAWHVEKAQSRFSEVLLSRAIHLMTLQMHVVGGVSGGGVDNGGSGCDGDLWGKNARALFFRWLQTGEDGGAAAPPIAEPKQPTPGELLLNAPLAQPETAGRTAGFAGGESAPAPQPTIPLAGVSAVGCGSGGRQAPLTLLVSIARAHSPAGPLLEDGIEWILKEAAAGDAGCAVALAGLGWGAAVLGAGEGGAAAAGGGGSAGVRAGGNGGNGGMTLADRKRKAQQQAMEAMARQQASFAQHMASGAMDDSSSEGEGAAHDEGETGSKADSGDGGGGERAGRVGCERGSSSASSRLPRSSVFEPLPPPLGPDCIMCHERAHKPVAYMGLAQRSMALARGVAANVHHELLGRQYVVVGSQGCQLRAGVELDSDKVALLPSGLGIEVLATQQVGRRVRVVAPVTRRPALRGYYADDGDVDGGGSSGAAGTVEGWASVQSAQGYVVLAPVREWAWQRWGEQRLHVGMCGHAVHTECFDAYFATLTEQSVHHQAYDGRMSIDVRRSEFFCPLCKSLCNVLVPYVPPPLRASAIYSVSESALAAAATAAAMAEEALRALPPPSAVAAAADGGPWGRFVDAGELAAFASATPAEKAGGGEPWVAVRCWQRRWDGEAAPVSPLAAALVAAAEHTHCEGKAFARDGGHEGVMQPLSRLADAFNKVVRPPWVASNGMWRPRQGGPAHGAHQLWAAVAATAAAAEVAAREAERSTVAEHGRDGGGGRLGTGRSSNGSGVGGLRNGNSASSGSGAGGGSLGNGNSASRSGGRVPESTALRRLLRITEHTWVFSHTTVGGREAPARSSAQEEVVLDLMDTNARQQASHKLGALLAGLKTVPSADGEHGRNGGGPELLSAAEAAWVREALHMPLCAAWDTTGRASAAPVRASVAAVDTFLDAMRQAMSEGAKARAAAFAVNGWVAGVGGHGSGSSGGDSGGNGGGGSGGDSRGNGEGGSSGVGGGSRGGGEDSGGSGTSGGGIGVEDSHPEEAARTAVRWLDIDWPVLHAPLLSWDLSTLAVALLALLRVPAERAAAVRLLCVARLCQILIEPAFCAWGMRPTAACTAGGTDTESFEAAAALERLRAGLADAAGMFVSPRAPTGPVLLAEAFAAWLPFLRTSALLLHAAFAPEDDDGVPPPAEGSGSGGTIGGFDPEQFMAAADRAMVAAVVAGDQDRLAALRALEAKIKNGAFRAGDGGVSATAPEKLLQAYRSTTGAVAHVCTDPGGPPARMLELMAATGALCAALAVPPPVAVVGSAPLVELARAWAAQYQHAYGKANPASSRYNLVPKAAATVVTAAGASAPAGSGIGPAAAAAEATPISSQESLEAELLFAVQPAGPAAAGAGAGGRGAALRFPSPWLQVEPVAAGGGDGGSDSEEEDVGGASGSGGVAAVATNGPMDDGAEEFVGGVAEEMGFELFPGAFDAMNEGEDDEDSDVSEEGGGGGDGGDAGGAGSAVDAVGAGNGGDAVAAGGAGGTNGAFQAWLLAAAYDGGDDESDDNGDGNHVGEDSADDGGDGDDNGDGGSDGQMDVSDGGAEGEEAGDGFIQVAASLTPVETAADMATAATGAVAADMVNLPGSAGSSAAMQAPLGVGSTQPTDSAGGGGGLAGGNRVLVEPPEPLKCPCMSNLTGTLTKPGVGAGGAAVPKSHLYDLSHLGLSAMDRGFLIDLPHSYLELHAQVKSPYCALDVPNFDPAVCLACGLVLAAGHRPSPAAQAGCCTLHARACGGGSGVFFLLHRCAVLLVRESRAAYYPSVYLDEHGEEDANLRRGRPLFLSRPRYAALRLLQAQHRVALEVSVLRSMSERVIRENYY